MELVQVQGTARNDTIDLPWIRTDGPGLPLLLINGLGSPRVAYEDGLVAEFVARGFWVTRFDNRDAGRAGTTEGGYRLADMAADAVAVMDHVGWDRAHVFGMSMGGMIAQSLGIEHPDRLLSITSLMSRTGNPDYGASTDEALQALMTPAPTDRDGWLDHRVATEKLWGSPADWSPETARAKGELLFDYGVRPDKVIHQWKAIVNSPPREQALAGVDTPTLILHGSADTLISPSGGRRTAEVMPNATYVELDGMGHDLPPRFWPIIADHLSDFVSDQSQ